MLKPSRRKTRPISGVSYTSRSWKGVRRRSTRVPSKYTPLPSFRRSKIFSDMGIGPRAAARSGARGDTSAVGDAFFQRQVAATLQPLDQDIGGLQGLEHRRIHA